MCVVCCVSCSQIAVRCHSPLLLCVVCFFGVWCLLFAVLCVLLVACRVLRVGCSLLVTGSW